MALRFDKLDLSYVVVLHSCGEESIELFNGLMLYTRVWPRYVSWKYLIMHRLLSVMPQCKKHIYP